MPSYRSDAYWRAVADCPIFRAQAAQLESDCLWSSSLFVIRSRLGHLGRSGTDVFRSQFRAPTAYRLGGLHSTLHAILVDVSRHYLLHYLPGVLSSPYRLKVLIILVYWAGIFAAVFVHAIRRAPGVWLLLMLRFFITVSSQCWTPMLSFHIT